MKVGMIGLGKIGIPFSVALDAAGHDVVGYDVSTRPAEYLRDREVPFQERGLPALLETHKVEVARSVSEVVARSDVVMVSVQTPHSDAYDGTVPAPPKRRDFEYSFLTQAVRDVCEAARAQSRHVVVVVTSTVLPGTFGRDLRPLANPFVTFLYSPVFVAMGTTIRDFTHPEFVLVGADDPGCEAVELVREMYRPVHDAPFRVVSIESAELVKVAYNVYLSSKVAWANYIGEVCHKTGADADEVTDSLALATDRILSPRYMSAGMGDGGGCHPRDLIALSHMAERLGLSYDLADALMTARERHSGWLADLTAELADHLGLPVWVMGKAYKPESNLTAGSPAALLKFQLQEDHGVVAGNWDPHVDEDVNPPMEKAVYFVATRHEAFRRLGVPAGSVVVDPWGIVEDEPGVTVVRVGRK